MKSFLELVKVVCLTLLFKFVTCAKPPSEGRIVGGDQIDISMCPSQVSVRSFDRHICAGTIISSDTILTVAHRTYGKIAGSLSIRHGSSYPYLGISHIVTQVIRHPDFIPFFNQNDVALLKVTPPIVFTGSSSPAELAAERSADGSEAIICGWGDFEDADTRLRAVTLRVIDQKVCQQAYPIRNDDSFMCAGARGKDTCQGDSGGGLMAKNKRQLIGISIHGNGSSVVGRKPGIYTSVPDVLEFIRDNL